MAYFQVLDNKAACAKVYVSGEIIKPQDGTTELSATWEYTPRFDTEYAKLYCGEQTINDVCPSSLQDRWNDSCVRMKAYLNCFKNAQVSLQEHCFYDMVPEHFLLEFFEIKNRITEHVLKTYKKPNDYDFVLGLTKVISEVKNRPVAIHLKNVDSIVLTRHSNKNLINKIKRSNGQISYNIHGTRTGRLTTFPNSFPILTLKKEFRSAIMPQNDMFVELDYNAAELRTLLALLGKEQPKEDIHEWNAKNVYRGLQTRKEAKERIFAWLYNSSSKDYLSNRAYDKEGLKQKYWDGKIVTTPYDRKIEADEFHALNYLIQSTTSDLFLRRVVAINELLKGRKSNITFMVHDSVVIDFSNEDKDIFKKMVDVFSQTGLGDFKVNTSIGKSFGEMKQL